MKTYTPEDVIHFCAFQDRGFVRPTDIEKRFSKIEKALKPNATFLIEDMVCVAPGGVMPERPAELLRTLVHASGL